MASSRAFREALLTLSTFPLESFDMRTLRLGQKTLVRALFVLLLSLAVLPSMVYAQAAAEPKGDPTGAVTGTASDVTVKDAKAPTLAEVMDTVGHNKVAINFVWTLITGF